MVGDSCHWAPFHKSCWADVFFVNLSYNLSYQLIIKTVIIRIWLLGLLRHDVMASYPLLGIVAMASFPSFFGIIGWSRFSANQNNWHKNLSVIRASFWHAVRQIQVMKLKFVHAIKFFCGRVATPARNLTKMEPWLAKNIFITLINLKWQPCHISK